LGAEITKSASAGGRSAFRVVRAASEPVFVGEMLHNVLDAALQDVAELVDGIDLHVLIVPEPVELGAVYIIMGIKIILGNTPLLHGLPQTLVCYHFHPPVALF
jgi:hypothetical protein